LGKELGLDRFATQEEMLRQKADAEMERKRKIWNGLSPKMKLAVGQRIIAKKVGPNEKKHR